MVVTLIADDLTGACDAGALFAGRGRVGVFVDNCSPVAEWDVAAVDTESRGLDPTAAAKRVDLTARCLKNRLASGVVFKKIDSTLRGPVGAELDALLSATGRRSALVSPAFPDQKRTVSHGVLLVNGQPAHLSPIGQDPVYPGPTSDVAAIVRRGATRPVSSLPLDRVRGRHEELALALSRAYDQIIVADAEVDADLDALARAALGCPQLVLAGSAGLARAVAESLGYSGPPMPLPEGRAWLIVGGSLHPATRAQLRAIEAAGVAGVRLDGPRDPDIRSLIAEIADGRPVFIATSDDLATVSDARGETAARLARLTTRVLAESHPDLVAITGGDTAVALLRALGATRLDLVGVPAPGLALGEIVNHGAPSVPLLTKAGGFGAPDLFLTLLKQAPSSPAAGGKGTPS